MNNQVVMEGAMEVVRREPGAYLPRLIRLALGELSAHRSRRVVHSAAERQDNALGSAERMQRMAELHRHMDVSMAVFQANPFDMCGR